MKKICVLDGTGHTEAATWEQGNPDSLAIASQTFDRLKREGYAAFALTKEGETVGALQEFDSDVEEITFLRPFAGG